jgi:predicted nucleic acid-binding Zn ribbon protein
MCKSYLLIVFNYLSREREIVESKSHLIIEITFLILTKKRRRQLRVNVLFLLFFNLILIIEFELSHLPFYHASKYE